MTDMQKAPSSEIEEVKRWRTYHFMSHYSGGGQFNSGAVSASVTNVPDLLSVISRRYSDLSSSSRNATIWRSGNVYVSLWDDNRFASLNILVVVPLFGSGSLGKSGNERYDVHVSRLLNKLDYVWISADGHDYEYGEHEEGEWDPRKLVKSLILKFPVLQVIKRGKGSHRSLVGGIR